MTENYLGEREEIQAQILKVLRRNTPYTVEIDKKGFITINRPDAEEALRLQVPRYNYVKVCLIGTGRGKMNASNIGFLMIGFGGIVLGTVSLFSFDMAYVVYLVLTVLFFFFGILGIICFILSYDWDKERRYNE